MTSFLLKELRHLTCKEAVYVAKGCGLLNTAFPSCTRFRCTRSGNYAKLTSAGVNRWSDCSIVSHSWLLTKNYSPRDQLAVRYFCSQSNNKNDVCKDTVLNSSWSEQNQRISDSATSNSEGIPHEQIVSDSSQNLGSEDVGQDLQSPLSSDFHSQIDSSVPVSTETSQSTSEKERNTVLATPLELDRDGADDSVAAHHSLEMCTISDSLQSSDVSNSEPSSVPRHSVQIEDSDLESLPPPRPMEPSYYLAPYVAQSLVLQQLVGLGVDLSAVEKVREAANFIVQADWDADVMPKLLFLKDLGLSDAELGPVLNKNPLVLKEPIEDMQERINYLKSKKFQQEQVTRIVTSAPLTLLLPVTYVDKKLGYLQKTFHLTGDEVRFLATRLPKIIPWKLQKLKDIRFYMKEMLGFSEKEMKAMLLATPRVFLSDRHQLGKRFDFLHNVMDLSHQHLSSWPGVFRTRLHVLQQRHRFLLLVGRAQYDPTKENYVSLKALVSGKDKDFCTNVAKASLTQFHNFLKSV